MMVPAESVMTALAECPLRAFTWTNCPSLAYLSAAIRGVSAPLAQAM